MSPRMKEDSVPETTPRLFETAGLAADLDDLRRTDMVADTAAAFDHEENNFLQLCDNIAAATTEPWIAYLGPVKTEMEKTETWITEAIEKWPAEKTRLVMARDQAVAEAAGRCKDSLEKLARENVRIELGEKPAPQPPPPPTKPVYDEPVPETALSEDEQEERRLTKLVQENRIRALGDPEKRLKDVHMHSPETKFWVGSGSSIVMGYQEYLMGFDITNAVLSREASFAITLAITLGTNILELFGIERFHFLLSFWSAKRAYHKLNAAVKSKFSAEPESPEMSTWVLGLGTLTFLAICIVALIMYRQNIIKANSYLAGTELAVFVLSALLVVTGVIHLCFTSPIPQRYVDRELELLNQLQVTQGRATDAKKARDDRNRVAMETARAAHQAAMAKYETAMEELKKPAPDPVKVIVEEYRSHLNEADQPLKDHVNLIHDRINYRNEIARECEQTLVDVVISTGYSELISDLLKVVEHNERRARREFGAEKYTETGPAKQITDLVKAACPCSLTNPKLDGQIASLDLSYPPAEQLTTFEPILEAARKDEHETITKRRHEEEQHRLELERAAAKEELEEAKRKLKGVTKFRPIIG